MYDVPSEHPRISPEELEYLQTHVEMDTSKQKKVSLRTPWLDILTSPPFLAVFSLFFALIWFNVTLALQLPMYLDMVHSVNIKTVTIHPAYSIVRFQFTVHSCFY